MSTCSISDLCAQLGALKKEINALKAAQKGLDLRKAYSGDASGYVAIPEIMGTTKDLTGQTLRLTFDGAVSLGYTEAKTWAKLVSLVEAGKNVVVRMNQMEVTSSETLNNTAASLLFVGLGSLDVNNTVVQIDVPVFVDRPRQIFFNYGLRESYPDRWNGNGCDVRGTFGGLYVRDPRWWGMKEDGPVGSTVTEDQAGLNVTAIAAAALGALVERPTRGRLGCIVQIPGGNFSVNRPVRIDGIKCLLRGDGSRASTLVGFNTGWDFDESHFITTEDFPSGTVPMVEIGYEWQPDANPDEGFKCGVAHLGLVAPLSNTKPVSGIMWESGLQENSFIRDVTVANYSGYGIGCPHFQHLGHNVTPETYYTQTNTVTLQEININSPNDLFTEAIGLCMFGLNWSVRDITIVHHNAIEENQTKPAAIIGARECGSVCNLHIEHDPPAGVDAPGVLIPADGKISRLSLDSIFCRWSTGDVSGKTSETIRIENNLAGVSCRNINHGSAEGVAINDVPRVKASTGQATNGASRHVAFYARQNNSFSHASYGFESTDPGLL